MFYDRFNTKQEIVSITKTRSVECISPKTECNRPTAQATYFLSHL